MRIGIDIDDTALITVNSMIKYADKYDIEDLGRTGTNGNLGLIKDRYYLKVLYGWDDETKFKFFNKYYKNVLEECIPMPDAPEIISQLKKDGHEIYFVTARLSNIPNCDVLKITNETFKKYNIPYDELIVSVKDKVTYAKEHNIDLFIEDSFETCVELAKAGIKALLVTTKMNESLYHSSVVRVNTWQEIYNKIKNS